MTLNIQFLNQLISNIHVAYIAKYKYTIVPFNKHILQILIFLKKHGYIISYYKNASLNSLKIYLRYNKFNPVIFKFVSLARPSRLIFLSYFDMNKIRGKYPNYVLLTKKGVIFLPEAIKLKMGGLLLFELE